MDAWTVRRRRARVYAVAVALAIGGSGIASANHYDDNPATGSFDPGFGITADNPVADALSGLTLRTTQRDHEDVIRSYRVAIPAGWRFSVASVDAAAVVSCRQANDPNIMNIMSKMEALGPVRIMLHTNATRDPNPQPPSSSSLFAPFEQPGPAKYEGYLWFLRWDAATSTAILCGRAVTGNQRVSNAMIVFQAALRLMPDASWEVSFNLDAVPGAPRGERSVTDNATFQESEVSVLEVMLKIQNATYGNFNKDPTGEKAHVPFTRNPAVPGTYRFTGTFNPCAADDPTRCDSGASPAVKAREVQITTLPGGYHPPAKLTAPTRFSAIRGTNAAELRWTQPATAPADPIRGYVVTVQVPNKPETRHFRYLVTDPGDPAYREAADPCAPGGAATSCSLSLEFPLATAGGQALSGNGQYAATLVTLFRDRHRSDGRCDDGTPLGAAPPCADGSTPAFEAPGFTDTDFLLRSRPWPLAYRQIVYRSDGRGVHQVYVLLADLEQHAFEFTIWIPVSVVYQGSGPGVAGTNSEGGAIAHLDASYSGRFGFQGTLTPVCAVGVLERLRGNLPTPLGGLVTPSEVILFRGGNVAVPLADTCQSLAI